MARRSRGQARDKRRLDDTAARLMVLGAVFVIAPLFLSATRFAKALSWLMPVGLLLLGGGAVLMWLLRRSVTADVPPPGDKPVVTSPRPVERSTSFAAAVTRVRPQAWGPAVFQAIEWRRFEAVVERLFQQAGFDTRAQSHGADEGVDVWLFSRSLPGEPVSLVQCKHWQGRRVGVDKVRELRGVMAAREVKRGQYVATGGFTPEASAFARENGVNLLDVDGLLGLIARRTPGEQAELLAVALEGDYWRPTCVNCGVKMVDRTPRKGGSAFWGCSNYPRCKTTMAMRGG